MAGSVSVMVTMHEGGRVEVRYPEDEVVCRYLMDKGRVCHSGTAAALRADQPALERTLGVTAADIAGSP